VRRDRGRRSVIDVSGFFACHTLLRVKIFNAEDAEGTEGFSLSESRFLFLPLFRFS
jgi:hypothetical protein